MTTLVIIIKREALFSVGAHRELLQVLLSLFVHVKTIIGHSKQIRNKKWCTLRRTTKRYVDQSPVQSRVEMLVATAWIQTGEAMRGFFFRRCSHKTRKVRYLLLKRQQWTLDSKESKCCNSRKMNCHRKTMTRDWRPYRICSRVNLLVATS